MGRQWREVDPAHRRRTHTRLAPRRRLLTRAACCALGVLCVLATAACDPTASGKDPKSKDPKASSEPDGKGESATVPIKLVEKDGARGKAKMVVTIAVGDGEPVKVLLDTGSSGLVLKDSALGKDHRSTGKRTKISYVDSSLTADIVEAPVRFTSAAEDLATPHMKIASFQGDPLKHLADFGADGILGIAQGTNSSEHPELLSPLHHLPEPFSRGFTIGGLQGDGSGGELSLGQVQKARDSVAVPMKKADFEYPNGSPGYKKSLPLCWTIGDAKACGDTTVDTGANAGIVSSTVMPDAPRKGQRIRQNAPVTIGSDSTVFCEFTAGASKADAAPRYMDRRTMNTGIRVFLTHTVGFDLKRGQMVLTPENAGSESSC